ncbi:MAG: AMP-binding protein, partial [Polyangiaceae bacterium]
MNAESKELTIVDIIQRFAVEKPSALAVRYLSGDGRDGDEQVIERSYGALERRARAIAAHLQSRAAFGDRAILAVSDSIADVEAFLGCLYAGVIAVPAYPPDPSRLARTLPRLAGIADDSGAALLLTSSDLAGMF